MSPGRSSELSWSGWKSTAVVLRHLVADSAPASLTPAFPTSSPGCSKTRHDEDWGFVLQMGSGCLIREDQSTATMRQKPAPQDPGNGHMSPSELNCAGVSVTGNPLTKWPSRVPQVAGKMGGLVTPGQSFLAGHRSPPGTSSVCGWNLENCSE